MNTSTPTKYGILFKKVAATAPSSKGGPPVTQQQLQFQRYMPTYERRSELSPSEEQMISQGRSQIIPKLFPSQADSPSVMMSNPTVPAIGSGLVAAVPGALAGGAIGGVLGGMANGDDGAGPGAIAGAGLGAVTLGLLGAMLGYKSRQSSNDSLEEHIRRMPEGGTIRDMLSDPVYQQDLERAHQRYLADREYSDAPRTGFGYNPGVTQWGM